MARAEIRIFGLHVLPSDPPGPRIKVMPIRAVSVPKRLPFRFNLAILGEFHDTRGCSPGAGLAPQPCGTIKATQSKAAQGPAW